MSLDAVKILEISITKNSKSEILEFIQKSLIIGAKKKEKVEKNASFAKKILTIVTPNPEQIVYAKHDPHFFELLNRADIALPDGIGIVWASRILSLKTTTYNLPAIQQVVPGIEFMEELVTIAVKQHVLIALIGGRDGLALKTFNCLSKTHPKLLGWAVDGPEIKIIKNSLHILNEDTEKYFKDLANKILVSGVRIIFVGLGAPKQEYFIEKLHSSLITHHSSINPIILMSVGGSFDEIAGRIPRAPQWASGLGLKWLWRLILEPWRIRRQFALIKFVFLVMKERYTAKN